MSGFKGFDIYLDTLLFITAQWFQFCSNIIKYANYYIVKVEYSHLDGPSIKINEKKLKNYILTEHSKANLIRDNFKSYEKQGIVFHIFGVETLSR